MDQLTWERLKNLFPNDQSMPPMAMPGIDTSRLDQTSNLPNPDVPSGLNTAPPNFNTSANAYYPRTQISSQLTGALTNMPVRPEPGKLRNVAASIAGLGGGSSAMGISGGQTIGFRFDPTNAARAENQVKYGDFNNQMQDWENQVGALSKGAAEEDRANTNERIRINNAETQEINRQKAQILQQRADALDKQTETNRIKEKDIHDTKMADMNRKIQEADAKLAVAKQNLTLRGQSIANLKAYHDAEIASIGARRLAQTEDDKFKLEDMQRLHTGQLERMKILNEKTVQDKNYAQETDVYDAQGNIKESAIKRRGPLSPASNIITDYTTNPPTHYDTSTWSENDKAMARAKGWK